MADLERGAAPGRGLGEYGFQIAFVDPWMGGVWTLGDIVDYQMIAALSFLEQSARFKRHYVMGRWRMASETIDRGEREGPGAYVIPIDQTDPLAAAELAGKLILQGIEVHEATESFEAVPQTGLWDTPADGTLAEAGSRADEGDRTEEGNDLEDEEAEGDEEAVAEDEEAEPGDQETVAEGEETEPGDEEAAAEEARTFPAGSWVVFGAQSTRAAVLDLLEPRNRRLQREWPDGPYRRSYDAAAYTMPLQMGVEAERVDAAAVGGVRRAAVATVVAPPVPTAESWFAFSAEVTRSYQAVNRLLDAGVTVSKAESEAGPVFLVPASDPLASGVLSQLSGEIGITVTVDPEGIENEIGQQAARVGIYQGWAGAMDEGWTRLVLEDFDYAYQLFRTRMCGRRISGTDSTSSSSPRRSL